MASRIVHRAGTVFDGLERRWTTLATQRRLASIFVISFVIALLAVELRRFAAIEPAIERWLPSNHFEAILVPFTLLLLAEVISLVFAIAQSVATAVGKQLEIMSLILIRQSFKELTYLPEPIVWDLSSTELTTRVLYIVSDAAGAILIFGLLVIYFRLQIHVPISQDPDERSSFVGAKKLIAVLLLVSIVIIGLEVIWFWLNGADIPSFFEIFYTVLIFADVFLVLISLRYSTAYPVVFRYFGFAVATVLIRLALTAPRVVDAGLGVIATLFAIALTWLYNRSLQTDAEAES
jgi:hypothetical protein